MLTVAIIIGIVGIGALGIVGRRRQTELSSWTVGKRDLPRWTSWFLQAGESLTTFSFLGLAGIAFGGGVAALFAVAYLTINCIVQYFVIPRQRELGANRGYLTMADFFQDRFNSKALGKTVALVGARLPHPVPAIADHRARLDCPACHRQRIGPRVQHGHGERAWLSCS